MLERAYVLKVIDTYARAWITQNAELIISIFTPKAIYHEQIMSRPIRGLGEIIKYWRRRVVAGQKNIKFKLVNLYIDGETAIAEWEAWFDVVQSAQRRHIKEVAILEFRSGKIASLREYWSSELVPLQKGTRRKSVCSGGTLRKRAVARKLPATRKHSDPSP